PQTLGARRARDHRPQPPLPGSLRAEGRADGAGLCLARHRHPRFAARSRPVHHHHRKAPGPESRLPGRNRLAAGLDFDRRPRRACRPVGEKRLRPIPAPPAGGSRAMIGRRLAIPDVVVFEPKVFADDRGVFFESFSTRAFLEFTGLSREFPQDNHSISRKGVLRGLHYQLPPHAQGKLVRVVRGAAFDVAVDIRAASPSFGQWVGELLSAENRRQLWVPEGFAHGFAALEDDTEFLYKTTALYDRGSERAIVWNDPDLDIAWPLDAAPIVS